MSLTLDSVAQTVVDVLADYLVSNQILTRLSGVDMRINMTTSVLYHTIDEIVFPLVSDRIEDLVRMIPLVGTKLGGWYRKLTGEGYLKVLLKIAMIGIIQQFTMGRIDALEGGVMLMSTYMVDFASEVKAVQDILKDYEFDIPFF